MRCPHRGFEHNGFCPYHGMLFKGESCSRFAPASCIVDAILSYDPKLQWEIRDDYGYMFLSVKQEVKAPWYLWMQNTADFNHVKMVHPAFARLLKGEPYDVRISEDLRSSSHRIRVQSETVKRYENILGVPLDGEFIHVISDLQISLTSFLGVFYSFEWALPSIGGGCVVTTNFYLSKSRPAPKVMLPAVIAANKKILAEDKEILERWAPTHEVTGNWLHHEARIKAFCQALTVEPK